MWERKACATLPRAGTRNDRAEKWKERGVQRVMGVMGESSSAKRCNMDASIIVV